MDKAILPPSTTTIIIEYFSDVVAANILPIIGVLGFAIGMLYMKSLFNSATEGRLAGIAERKAQYDYDHRGDF